MGGPCVRLRQQAEIAPRIKRRPAARDAVRRASTSGHDRRYGRPGPAPGDVIRVHRQVPAIDGIEPGMIHIDGPSMTSRRLHTHSMSHHEPRKLVSWRKSQGNCLDRITLASTTGLSCGQGRTHQETTMALKIDDFPAAIRQAKQELRERLPTYREVFAEVDEAIRTEARKISERRNRGENVIPEIQFS